ncbi:type II secretion system protein N [Paraglaciecola sp. 2405UD69-4]|uniref:type II secretion system protein N n=1 Tax=Paraglaciecola sp. 2405UD69-4 TaxID=3391836 RepID=UPI0039C9F413
MKLVLKWSLLALLVYGIFLVAKLPAVQVISRVDLGKDIKISGVTGTIWEGNLQQVVVKGIPLNDVDWSLSFLPLLLGKAEAVISAGNIRDLEQISIDGVVTVSNQRIQADNLVAYVPTEFVISALPLPIPVEANGRFKVQLNALDYTKSCQVIEGTGQWLNASFTGPQDVINLGNFNADLSCLDENVIVDVKEPNSFGLSAKVTLPANMKFKVNGRFKPDASLPKEVHQAASFFGKPDSNGYYPVKL